MTADGFPLAAGRRHLSCPHVEVAVAVRHAGLRAEPPSRDLAGVALGVRGMGARDLVVGLGAVRATADPEIAAWLTGAALIDLSDVLTLLLALRRMPLLRNLLFVALALGGAAAELYVAADLRKGPGPGEHSNPVEG